MRIPRKKLQQQLHKKPAWQMNLNVRTLFQDLATSIPYSQCLAPSLMNYQTVQVLRDTRMSYWKLWVHQLHSTSKVKNWSMEVFTHWPSYTLQTSPFRTKHSKKNIHKGIVPQMMPQHVFLDKMQKIPVCKGCNKMHVLFHSVRCHPHTLTHVNIRSCPTPLQGFSCKTFIDWNRRRIYI